MKILGLSAFYHDSAAAMLVNGEIVAAAQEERFTRIKNDSSFPLHSVQFCVENFGKPDVVVFYDKPFLKFERMLETFLAFAPRGIGNFLKSMPVWINGKLNTRELIKNKMEELGLGDVPVKFSTHHLSHAASAFFPSPFTESAILTVDGVGEWSTATLSFGVSNKIKIIEEQRFPHSIGLLYSAFTQFCGFKVNSGEYKMMGLAPYGDPNSERVERIKKIILNQFITLHADGSVWLNMDFFDFGHAESMINKARWEKALGIPVREPESMLTQEYADVALAIQLITRESVFRLAKKVKELTGSKNLCLAGGVALNCVINGELIESKIFDKVWIQPAAGDAGGALGAALAYWYIGQEQKRSPQPSDSMKGSYLGPQWSDNEISQRADSWGVKFHTYSEDELYHRVSKLLAEGHIIGWFQGRMEFGPRALGGRSIIGDPRKIDMQKKMNLKIKFRESFRPFAPSVLESEAKNVFIMGASSKYMLTIDWVKPESRVKLPLDFHKQSFDFRLGFSRSTWPSITHMDYSARLQTVDGEFNPRYFKLISEFHRLTNCPLIINTSFNIRGEPIVCRPEEAYYCFFKTEMDVLVLGNNIFIKTEQPKELPTKIKVSPQILMPD